MNNAIAAGRVAGFRFYTRKEKEEERRLGVCTKLGLKPYDPWTIRKTLFKSDVDGSSRLLLGKDVVEKYVIPYIGPCWDREGCANDVVTGCKVSVFDIDTGTVHQLVLKRWSTESFVLTSNWVKEFVRRRALEKGNEIGLFWDPWNARFCFGLLRKAAAPHN
ncbi:B3 domain-containing protein At2g33720-like [Rhododendron vialii]|uniref:B3 domain-containing protein At2g33720-like n=1 Tax=Rhododendron vialii TaxID=182163 RepID=UPI00265E68BB|nr:B3 domain-containing protein At2g33720-like [Rhododendron vialii]